MDCYHGSTVPELTELRCGGPDSVVYLTRSRPYALLYIRNRDLNYVTAGFRPDGTLIYEEWFPGQLELLYRGQSGYLYCCEERDLLPGKNRGILVAHSPVPVKSREYIEDVFEAIYREILAGRIRHLTYDSLSGQRKVQMHEGMVRLFTELDEGAISPEKLAFYRKYFPAAWREAKGVGA